MATTDCVLAFDLDLKTLPVKLGSDNYVIKELNGTQREQYMNQMKARSEKDLKTGKTIGIKSFEGIHTSILALCLYKEGSESPVKEATMKGWPASVLERLAEEALKLSGMSVKGKTQEEDEGEEGND